MPLESELYMSLYSNLFLVLIDNEYKKEHAQRVEKDNVNEAVPL